MTTVVSVAQGGTGANSAALARTALGAAPLAAYDAANNAYAAANTGNLLSGGIITGTLNVTQDIIVGGNVYLEGNTTYINVATYSIEDSLMYLASNNSLTDSVDIGIMGGKNTSGTYSHTGFARDATDGKWKLFDGLPEEGHVGNVVNFANTYLATLVANVEANSITLVGNTVSTQANLTVAHNQANSSYAQANSAYGAANNRVLKAGDTMTGNLILSGASLVLSSTSNDQRLIDAEGTSATGRHVAFPLRFMIGSASSGYPFAGYNAIPRANGAYSYSTSDTAWGISYGNSSRMGFYYAASGTAGANITFSELMTIAASGNVGIGSGTPAYKLDVNGTSIFRDTLNFGSGALISWTTGYSDGTTQTFNSPSSGSLAFVTNSSLAMFIKSNQNIGIGTANPAYLLDVQGGTARFGSNTYNSNILFGNEQGSWGSGIRVYDNNDAELRIWHLNGRGQIILATGYNGNGSTSLPSDGLFIVGDPTASPSLKVGVGYTAANLRGGGAKLAVNGNVGVNQTSPSYNVHIGKAASGDNHDYGLLVERHGTGASPGSWSTTKAAINITDTANAGPSSGDTTGLFYINLGRMAVSAANAKNATITHIGYDDGANSPWRIDGKGNHWVGWNRSTPHTNDGSFCLLVRKGISVGSNYQTTTPPDNGAIIEGNVGIGISNPTIRLQVQGTGATLFSSSLYHVVTNSGAAAGQGMLLGYHTGSGVGGLIAGDAVGGSENNLIVGGYTGSAWQEVMRVKGTANVMIGHSSVTCMRTGSISAAGAVMSSAGRYIVGWYSVAPQSSTTYTHLKTSLWGGGSPNGNIDYWMGGFEITGYVYSTNANVKQIIQFHNWSGTVNNNYQKTSYGSYDPDNIAYVGSDGYVYIRLVAGQYLAYRIDVNQYEMYVVRDIRVTSVTNSNSATL